jgi:hypothetical protein
MSRSINEGREMKEERKIKIGRKMKEERRKEHLPFAEKDPCGQ